MSASDLTPEWLRDDLDAVLADVALPAGVTVQITSDPYWGVDVRENGRAGGGSYVSEESDSAERRRVIADGIQEAIAETQTGWGSAVPACRPGHGHPAAPEVVDGTAVWICPDDDGVIAPIGSYPADH